MSTLYSVGQMNQVADAFEAAGFTPDDVTKLRSFSRLGDFKNVLKGFAEIVVVVYVVDLDKDPHVPENWKVESHKKGGQLEWSPNKVRLFLSPNQEGGKWIKGEKLQPEVVAQSPYNANLLDFLLAHPELIPEEWKGKAVFFWNTVYRNSDGILCVRFLCWLGDRWYWGYSWLDGDFNSSSPAACSQVSSDIVLGP